MPRTSKFVQNYIFHQEYNSATETIAKHDTEKSLDSLVSLYVLYVPQMTNRNLEVTNPWGAKLKEDAFAVLDYSVHLMTAHISVLL